MRLHVLRALLRGAAAVLAVSVTSAAASAQLFNTGVGNSSSGPLFEYKGPQLGVGQGVSVTNTTQISSFGFYLGAVDVPLNYFIFDGSNSHILFSQTKRVSGGIEPGTLTLTDPFSFTLNAGQTYYFGVIGLYYGYPYNASLFSPGIDLTQNGISLVRPGVTYVGGFDGAPHLYAPYVGPTVALEINGVTAAVVPEPATMLLSGVGLPTLGMMARRRRRTTA